LQNQINPIHPDQIIKEQLTASHMYKAMKGCNKHAWERGGAVHKHEQPHRRQQQLAEASIVYTLWQEMGTVCRL